jgi:hypothetical protein
VELQRRYPEIRGQGLGLIAISYDSPETLKKFSESRSITYPLIADRDSTIIRSFGILNESEKPGSRGYGIPYPGTFIVDRNGRVVSRFFEEAYQERYTAAAMLSMRGAAPGAPAMTARTAHLSIAAAISDATASPGHRLSITIDVTPAPGIHVYAPGKHDYQVVKLTLTPQPWLRVHAPVYPPSEIYHFKPLDERVEVYTTPFRLRTDVTILATPEIQKLLAATPSVTIAGALEYQACDDKLCFTPARVPISFGLAMHPLDRRPPGDR